MPWVDKDECIGCGICVNECPAEAIEMVEDKAEIDMESCIRCGICHSACNVGAVKHDSEKIPEEIEANIQWSQNQMNACADKLGDPGEAQKCLNRLIKHFNKEKKVVEETLARLEKLKG